MGLQIIPNKIKLRKGKEDFTKRLEVDHYKPIDRNRGNFQVLGIHPYHDPIGQRLA